MLLLLLALQERPCASAEEPVGSKASPGQAFSLPETPFSYSKTSLPPHFRPRQSRRFDNTPADNPITDDGATLGRVLFYERRLSADNSISCATCHDQKHAFASPDRFARGVGGKVGDRNSMSLTNARYHLGGRFFWDERAESLEKQVLEPIANPIEMAQDVDSAVATLAADPAYAPLFEKAFGDAAVTRDRLAKALAQFVRSLVSYQSKFDEGMADSRSISDDFANFSAAENRGKAIFLGDHDRSTRGNCASCHLQRPPIDPNGPMSFFSANRLMNNGLDRDFTGLDNGLGDRTLDPRDYGLFKSPDLRNVELTAPYMHDGRLATLEAVVDHYNSGVQPHPNLDPRLRIGPGRPGPRRLNLNDADKAALVAFLKTLTDRKFVEDPRFSDPFRR